MKISLIAAVGRNGVIGAEGGGLPWRFPADSEHFRSYTRGKWMLLGRKTYLEMEGWFQDQIPVVLTRSPGMPISGGFCVNSIEEAISLGRGHRVEELVVSGGGETYHEAISRVTKMVITRIDGDFEGTTTFPDFDMSEWLKETSHFMGRDKFNRCDMTVETYVRKTGTGMVDF